MISPWKFPDKTLFRRIVPKNKIYEHSSASARLKSLFVEQVEQILWAYKLSPNTLNIQESEKVTEIQVFSLKLKGDSIDESVLKAIDMTISFPILFEICNVNKEQCYYAACYKQMVGNGLTKWACSRYLRSETYDLKKVSENTADRVNLPTAITMDELYQKILNRLLPITQRTTEKIEDAIERMESIQVLEKQILQMKKRVDAAKQFNRKVELNKELKNLKCKLEKLLA